MDCWFHDREGRDSYDTKTHVCIGESHDALVRHGGGPYRSKKRLFRVPDLPRVVFSQCSHVHTFDPKMVVGS